MKSSELRIGNLVDLGNRIAKVIEIAHLGCVVVDLEETQDTIEDYERTKGIPLTEEWLLKFGFEKIEDFGVYSNIWHFKGVMVSLGNYINVHVDWADDGVGFHSIRCYEELFIHQLQNLYFALTGEELILNA
jgi:hypothetical protein